jgi:16S rRNA (guanine966-N2)-methyltransferase
MRVVAGTARGRPLVAPAGRDTRPTSDRVREAVFNALGSMDAVVGATVLDLFAGSGALGIEALSRGAAHCTFVDPAREAVAAIRQNLSHTGLADGASVITDRAESFLAGFCGPVDLALCDPPYAFDQWPQLLAMIPAVIVVCESNRPIELGPALCAIRSRRYGGTVVTFGGAAGDHET